jgi:hypothetical protein
MWFSRKHYQHEAPAPFEDATSPLLDGLDDDGAVKKAQVLARSYQDLHDCRTKVEGLRDRTRAAQQSRVVDLSIFQEIKLAAKGIAMHIEEFDLVAGTVASWNIEQIQEIDSLRNGFESLRIALGLLHGVLSQPEQSRDGHI